LIDEEKLVRVNRAHVVSTAGHSVTLSTGETIQTDAIVFCTGWEPALPPLFANPLANEVGMSIAPTSIPAIERQYWEALDTAAEKQVLEDYPVLRNPPSDVHIPRMDKSPFRHFRAVVPPKLAARGDNSLVFLGNYATGRIQTTAEIYSLWAVAYLEGLMPPSTKAILSDEEAMHEDIAHIEAYRKKRYLNGLSPYRLSIIETPEFDDLMLGDLGVRPDRKAMKIPTGWRGWFGFKGWFAEWFDSYFADDFKGIIEEFLENVEKRGGRSKIIDERTPLVNGMK
jgi:dimethylaniline monooxygenase (N-oxide forming)